MNRKKQLEKEINERRAELYELDQIQRDAENQKLVGNCFKYINSFGDGKIWPVYFLVTHLDDGDPRCVRFEKDSHGTTTINFNENYPNHSGNAPISRREFDSAFRLLLNEIRNNSEFFLATNSAIS